MIKTNKIIVHTTPRTRNIMTLVSWKNDFLRDELLLARIEINKNKSFFVYSTIIRVGCPQEIIRKNS
jgi:hypothetical protein